MRGSKGASYATDAGVSGTPRPLHVIASVAKQSTSPHAVALAAIVILIFPMGYFFLAAPAFLLVKLDIPSVNQLLRGMFNAHFLMTSITAVMACWPLLRRVDWFSSSASA